MKIDKSSMFENLGSISMCGKILNIKQTQNMRMPRAYCTVKFVTYICLPEMCWNVFLSCFTFSPGIFVYTLPSDLVSAANSRTEKTKSTAALIKMDQIHAGIYELRSDRFEKDALVRCSRVIG